MARITLVLDVPLSVDECKQLVHLWDAEQSEPEEGIDPQHVKGSDFMTMFFAGGYTGATSKSGIGSIPADLNEFEVNTIEETP